MNKLITISREYGSGGRVVGKLVAVQRRSDLNEREAFSGTV